MKNIYYSNRQNFNIVLDKIKQDGTDKLHILADFDRTLTKAFSKDGQKRTSLIAVLRNEGYLSEEYRDSAQGFFNIYNPIEIDPNISMEEKSAKMTEWWNKHLQLLVESGLNKKDINSVSNSGIIELRPGVKKLLNLLNIKKIPLVIISANGLGTDSIKLYLTKEEFLTDNINIISNSFKWDSKGNAIGYDNRVIHTFNKGERVLNEYPNIYDKIKGKKNVILLGDSLGDHHMVDGFDYENLIKIGFLNNNEDSLLDEYLNRYDVVLTGDNDGKFLGKLLN